jgi:hypothetical protein
LGLLVFGLYPSSTLLKGITLRKLDLLPSLGKRWKTPTVFGLLGETISTLSIDRGQILMTDQKEQV